MEMTKDQDKLEEYLIGLKDEIVTVIADVNKNDISPNLWCYKESRFSAIVGKI